MNTRCMGNLIIARVRTGEEIIESLRLLARSQEIPFAALCGLGAVSEATLAAYDLSARTYRETRFAEELELASMVGNIAWLGDEPVIHAHGVFSRVDCTTVSGHIMRAVVSATGEIMLTVGAERVERAPDEAVGLNLLDLAD